MQRSVRSAGSPTRLDAGERSHVLAVMNQLFGLPAHPLLVHVPIALVPIAAAGLVAIAISATWRQRIGWWVVGTAAVSLLFVQLAMSSGESLQEHVGERALVQRHAELADPLRPLSFAVVALSGALMFVDRRRRTVAPGRMHTVQAVVVVASVVAAGTSVVQLARVGHSGAKAVWHETPTSRRRTEARDAD